MQTIHSLIREVIAEIGRPASSSHIVRRLRKRGVQVNYHTVMKQLAVPRFELRQGLAERATAGRVVSGGGRGVSAIKSHTIKARFVGGPLHNEVIEIADRTFMQAAVTDWPRAEQHSYHRRRLVTAETGTPFIEYWHESLLGTPQEKRRCVPTWGPLATEYDDVISVRVAV